MEEEQPKPRTLADRVRTMDKRLRLMLIATALLLVPGIGQFVALRDLAVDQQLSNLAIFFIFTAIFIVPTSLILTGAILYVIRKDWRRHEKLAILGVLNLLLILNVTWFFIHACSWGAVFGVTIPTCK
jgi:predicted permease